MSEPNGLENLRAILDDQPYQNSALSVFEINLILANEGGFMPDEAAAWFRASRGTFRVKAAHLSTVAKRNAFYSSDEYRNMTTAEKCAVQGDGFINDYD